MNQPGQGKDMKRKAQKKTWHDEMVNQNISADENNPASRQVNESEGVMEGFLQDYEKIKQELDSIKEKALENFEGWQRERADFVNYKKRIERDQILIGQQMKGDIIKQYLQVLDDLELALKSKPSSEEGKKWAEGIELITRKLRTILESEGVTKIEADKVNFDPTIHEAISNEPSRTHKSGEIIEVVQNGYLIGDRVLRPAKVRVAI